MKKNIIFLFIVFLSSNVVCLSQDIKPFNPTVDKIVNFEAIPTDPVFDLLQLNGAKIETPGTVQKFLASLTSASSTNGKLVTGIALTFAPYQIFNGQNLYLKDYVSKLGTRVLTNTQLSFGTAPSINSDSSLNWGIGIRVSIFNSGDGRLDPKNIKELVKKAENEFTADPFPKILPDSASMKKWEDNTKNTTDKLTNDAVKTGKPTWNAGYLDFNIGTIFKATNSQIQESGFEKFRAWINGGFYLGSLFQFLGQVGYVYNNGNNGVKDSSQLSSAAMLRVGTSNFRIGFGVSGTDFNKGYLSTAGEIRISESGWITFALDRNIEKNMHPSSWIVNGGIKTSIGNINF